MVTHVVNWLLDSMVVVHYQRLVYIAFYIVQISSSMRTVEDRERWKVITGSILILPSSKKVDRAYWFRVVHPCVHSSRF